VGISISLEKDVRRTLGTLTSIGPIIFNDWINKFNLMELKNPSRQFSWANNQDNLA
jgi:hypothetical protein